MKIPQRNIIKIHFEHDLDRHLFIRSRQGFKSAQKHIAEFFLAKLLLDVSVDTIVYSGSHARAIASYFGKSALPVSKINQIDVDERVAILADKGNIQGVYGRIVTQAFPLKTYVVKFYDASDNELFL